MNSIKTAIEGVYIIEPPLFKDSRGHFFESFHQDKLADILPARPFVQDNESYSVKGTLRGLHLQTGEFSQAKYVRVVQGAVFDVVVDLRPGSSTFGKWVGVELSSDNKRALYIPRQCAHGFYALDNTILVYKCDNFYSGSHDVSIAWNDPDIAIQWPSFSSGEPFLSDKDNKGISFNHYVSQYCQ